MSEQTPKKIIVGTPAYNEEKYIGSIVLQARQYADEVIVVDDGSTDRTSLIAELAGAHVIRHAENEGYGSAIQSIMAEAVTRNADILIILDADSQHNPDEIPSLVEAISQDYDVVIGSREMQSNVIPPYRRVGQRVLSNMTRILARQKISDTESGFRAYSKKAINALELKEKGMAISSEIVTSATRKNLRIKEVPISVSYTKDSSSLNPVRHGVSVLNRILVMISEKRPLLFFGAFGALLILFGIFTGVMVVKFFYANEILQIGSALISMLFITIGVLVISTGVILSVLAKRISDQL
jgi:glycosyltransferase involved in cell wall biosynthesis